MGFPMAKCSFEFTTLSGPLARGAKLLDWVLNPNEFCAWVQSTCNLQHDLEPRLPEFGIRLDLPHRPNSELEARVKIEMEDGLDIDDDGGLSVKVVFLDVRPAQRQRQRRRSRDDAGAVAPPHRVGHAATQEVAAVSH